MQSFFFMTTAHSLSTHASSVSHNTHHCIPLPHHHPRLLLMDHNFKGHTPKHQDDISEPPHPHSLPLFEVLPPNNTTICLDHSERVWKFGVGTPKQRLGMELRPLFFCHLRLISFCLSSLPKQKEVRRKASIG